MMEIMLGVLVVGLLAAWIVFFAYGVIRHVKWYRKQRHKRKTINQLNNAAARILNDPDWQAVVDSFQKEEPVALPERGVPEECFREADQVMSHLLNRIHQTGKPASGTIDYIGEKAVSYTIDDEDET